MKSDSRENLAAKLILKKGLGGLLIAGASGLAWADSCDSVIYDFGIYYSGDTYAQDRVATNQPECFGGGGVTSTIRINATAFSHATAISGSIASRLSSSVDNPALGLSPSYKGMAAGGNFQAWNIWANIDNIDTSYGYGAPNGGRTRGDNSILTAVLGADYALKPGMVLGISAAFDNGNGQGRNGATASNRNNTEGFLIAPYWGYQISKEWSTDLSAGLGRGRFSATGGVKSEADRLFAAANLNYARWLGRWQFTGKASYLHGKEDYDNTKVNGVRFANTDVKNRLDQLRFGAQAGYWMNGVMPYGKLSYSYNVHRASQAGDDQLGRGTFIATLGVNFFSLASKVTGGVMFEQELSRSNSSSRVLAANINLRF